MASPAPAGAEPPSDHDLMSGLRRVMHTLRRHSMTALEPFGLTPHQGRAFLTISRAPEPLRLKDLAEQLRIAPRSATEVVDALEERGLVRRGSAPEDRRATVLSLTAEGGRVADRVRAAQADQPALAVLGEDERRQLQAILNRVNEAVDGECR